MANIVITVEYRDPPEIAYCSSPKPSAAPMASRIERRCPPAWP